MAALPSAVTQWADVNCQAVLEAAPDAMFVVNRTGEILAANLQAEKLYGLSRGKLIGTVIESLLPLRCRERHRQHRENFLANSKAQFLQMPDMVALRGCASEFPVEVSLSRLTAGSETFAICAVRDTTERVRVEELKRSETVLRESEGRFRSLADSAPVLIWESDADKLCTYFNKTWLDFTGRSMDQELGNGWAQGVHVDDFQRCLDTYSQSFDRREKFRMEYRLRHRDGEYRWILDIGVPRFNQGGSFEGYIGIGVDIDERKRVEQECRLSEKRFREFFETMPEYCYIVSPQGEIIDVNRHACATLGYSKDELVGQTISTLYAPECHLKMRELFEKWKAEGELGNEEMLIVTKQGQRRTVLLNVGSVRDSQGQILHSTSVQVDITERKRAEDAVKESEQRFRLVADNAPVMIWMSGLDKKPTYFNQPWQNFTGLSETDLRNGLVGIVHPDDYQQCHEEYCRGFDQRRPFKKECRLRRHDGQYRWMLDIGVPRFHQDGSFAGYIGSCIDVTDQKLAEEALSEMTRKLVEAHEQERTRIARELHDDISQRLALLAVELERLQDDPPAVRSRVQELIKQTTEISNGVQALSHDLHSSQLEYLGVVAGMKSWCKEFGERRGLQIDCRHHVRSTPPPEIGLCLFRVLQEALHNAAKHSGVERIEVELSESAGEIHLTIRDLGKGFDMETARQGRGLGLTSMRERVRLVNGTITIQSKPMGGTTIHVRVPFTPVDDAQLAAG